MLWFTEILSTLKEMLSLLRQIVKALKHCAHKPGIVRFKLSKEENGMLYGKFSLPTPGATDVVTRRLTIAVDDNEPVVVSLDGAATESEEIGFEDGAVITGSLVDIDDADNESQPSEFTFTVVDNLAPPKPGEVGFSITREETPTEE